MVNLSQASWRQIPRQDSRQWHTLLAKKHGSRDEQKKMDLQSAARRARARKSVGQLDITVRALKAILLESLQGPELDVVTLRERLEGVDESPAPDY